MQSYIPRGPATTSDAEWTPKRQQTVAHFPHALISARVVASSRDFRIESTPKSVDNMLMVLRDLVREQQRTNALLEQLLATAQPSPAELEIRDIPDEEALEEIKAMFEAATEDLYYSDIADELRLPLPQVVRVCVRLMDDGVVGVAD